MGIECARHLSRARILAQAQMQTRLCWFKRQIFRRRARAHTEPVRVDESVEYRARAELRRVVRPSLRDNLLLQQLRLARALRRALRQRDRAIQGAVSQGGGFDGRLTGDTETEFHAR